MINYIFFKGYSLILNRTDLLGLYHWSNLCLWGAKEVYDSIHLIRQLLVTSIHILNQMPKYSTHLSGKHVKDIKVTFIHLLSHCHHEICSESWDRLGTESHP